MGSTVDGLVSGLDTTTLISQLMRVEAVPQDLLKTKLKTQKSIQAVYQTLNTKLATLETAAKTLVPSVLSDAWQSVKATSSSTSVAATASSSAATGTFTFDVKELARTNVVTATYASAATPALKNGLTQIALSIGGGAPVTIDVTVNTPQGVADAINARKLDVRAAAVTTDQGTVLQLTATKTGTAGAVAFADTRATALSGTVATGGNPLSVADTTAITITGDFQKADGSFEAGKVATITFGDGLGNPEVFNTVADYQAALQSKIDTAIGGDYAAGTVKAAVTDQGGGVWKVELYSAKALVADGADSDTLPDGSTFTVADAGGGGAVALGLPQATSAALKGLTVTSVQAVAATDAQIQVGELGSGGYTATSSTNTFTGLVPGVSLTVSKIESVITLTVASDGAGIADKVKAMVDGVNALLTEVTKNTAYDPDTKTASLLTGNFMLRNLASRAVSAVSNGAGAVLGSYKGYGIELAKDGKSITFDRDAFMAAYTADPTKTQSAMTDATNGLVVKLRDFADGAQTDLTGVIQNGDSLVKDLNNRISNWDVRLKLRQERLQKQFSGLETALSKLQNQSSWLAGQISSLPKWE